LKTIMEHCYNNKENMIATKKELVEIKGDMTIQKLTMERLTISNKQKSERSASQPNFRHQKNKTKPSEMSNLQINEVDRCSSVRQIKSRQDYNRFNDSNNSKTANRKPSIISTSYYRQNESQKSSVNIFSNGSKFAQGSNFNINSSNYRQRQLYQSNYHTQSLMTKSTIPLVTVEIHLMEKDHSESVRNIVEYRCPIEPDAELDSHLEMVWKDGDEMLNEQRNKYFQFYEAMKQVHVMNWLRSQTAEEQRLYLDRTNRSMASVC